MIEIGDKCRIVGMIDYPQFNGEIVDIIGIASYTEGNKYYIQSDNKELRESCDWVWFSRLEKITQEMSKKEKYARDLIKEFNPKPKIYFDGKLRKARTIKKWLTEEAVDNGWYSTQTVEDMRDCIIQLFERIKELEK